jgi:hypothetical protein
MSTTAIRRAHLLARLKPVSPLVAILVLPATLASARADDAPGVAAERSFTGTWSASGRRYTVAVEEGRTASVVEVSGAVVLAGGDGISRGFRGEAIGLDDGEGKSTARCVWTDDRGDKLFSRLAGDALQEGRRFVGTITGGTGRYAGASGEYSFTWQYVLPAGDGNVQGRAVGLAGRIRSGKGAR